jgi:hypothetical protein
MSALRLLPLLVITLLIALPARAGVVLLRDADRERSRRRGSAPITC